MSELRNDIVVSSRIRLARNYYDLPFSNASHAENAETCITRAKSALRSAENTADPNHTYTLYTLKDMSATNRTALMEEHLISMELLQNSQASAALVRDDQSVSVMINEEDHLRIQAMLFGMRLEDAASLAFDVEEKLQGHCAFSFDSQLGYLTACPTNTGTGMRASLMLHLPLLAFAKQMGNVTQSVAKLGLTIRGIYGEGSEALGDLYQVSNQVTLGRTEKEIIEAVIAVGKQLIDMEQALRTRAAQEANLTLQDRVFRSYGVLRYAKLMNTKDFMEHWSSLRLGVSLGMLPTGLARVNELLSIAQDAHVKQYRQTHTSILSTDQARCEIIRAKLIPDSQEV